MKDTVENKMLAELGMGQKQEVVTPPKTHPFGRRFIDKPNRTFRQAETRLPLPKAKPYPTNQHLTRLDYQSHPPKARTQHFKDWAEEVGWKWQDVCSSMDTEYFKEVRDFFLSKKRELFQ